MPTLPLMTWVSSQRLWTKRYIGRRYYISCRQLGIKPETKEASIQAANQWWRDKQAELDYAEKAKYRAQLRLPEPMEDIAAASLGQPADLFGNVRVLLEQALLREEEQRQRGEPLPAALPGIADDINADIALDSEPEDAESVRRREVMALLERLLFGDGKLAKSEAEQLPPARVTQVERAVQELKGESAADPARTVGALAQEWLDGQRVQVTIGGITAMTLYTQQQMLAHSTAYFGEGADVYAIDAENLEGFHNFCLSKIAERREDAKAGWSASYAKSVFGTARQWIGWLVERGTIPAPPNLRRGWRFGSVAKKIETWPVEEVRRVAGEAKGKLRLCLLLMLNIGATQKDVADLRDNEVDWREGRVERKRSKTSKLDSVPVVNYPLWPCTFALLKEHRSGEDRILLTEGGKPYVHKRLVGNAPCATDQFAVMFRRLTNKLGIKRPLRQLRKTSASLLENHTVTLSSGELVNPYANCVSLFLGHSPKSMKEKHYAKPPAALFDSAVMWLGQQYGFVDA